MADLTDKEKAQRLDDLLDAIDKTYHHTGRLAWRGFLLGLASGLGTTIGVALVLTILTFLLRELGGVPVIGQWFNSVGAILPKR